VQSVRREGEGVKRKAALYGGRFYRMMSPLSRSETARTTGVFLERFPPAAWPKVMLMSS
jgi:hypothetical protein